MDNQILDSPLESEIKQENIILAGKGARLLNYLLDTLAIYVLVIVLVFGLAYFRMVTEEDLDNRFVSYLIFYGLSFFYYLVTESLWGKSPAKFITQTRVLNSDGTRSDSGTIVKRTLCRIIPFDGLSFLGTRGWHDSIPDVVVIKE